MADENVAQKGGPLFWRSRKRPSLGATPIQDERTKQVEWDTLYSGARSSLKWEDEWPEMSEAEFDKALEDVSKLSLGGHYPDGSHPENASKAQE